MTFKIEINKLPVSVFSLLRRRSLGSSRNLPPPRGGGRLRDEPKERLRRRLVSIHFESVSIYFNLKPSSFISDLTQSHISIQLIFCSSRCVVVEVFLFDLVLN